MYSRHSRHLRKARSPVFVPVFVLAMRLSFCSPLYAQAQQTTQENSPSGEVSLQVVVVRSPEEAQQVLDRLKKGEDFGSLAREKSIDSTASAGGYMGKFEPKELRAELRDALRGLGPGEVSPVAKIPSGYAILKVMKASAPGDPGSAADPSRDLSRILPLAATGDIKYMPNLSGLVEATYAISQYPDKPTDWNLNPQNVCKMRKESMAATIDYLKDFIAPENPASHQPLEIMQAYYFLGQLHAYQGEMEQAIKQIERAYQVAASSIPDSIPSMEEALGIFYLHKSEIENGAFSAPGEKCLFPISAGSAYKKTADSEKSIEFLMKFLDRKPDSLEVKWLLNLAYMTLGKYPAGVPAKYLIPPSLFESKENIGRFRDVAPEAGLDKFSMSGGVIVDDFENNGLLNVVTSSNGVCEPLHFFHNNGDGTFTNKSAEAGLSEQLGGLNIMQTDYNNDGCLDILVLRGGWEFAQRKSLLRNNCDGTFTDVTVASGLGNEATTTQTGVWADINNDGLLDLFVGREDGSNQLFLNKGDGTFEDISKSAGIDKSAFTKGVVAADYDNDGYVDFFVSSYGKKILYHNNHDNTFTDVAEDAGVSDPGQSFAAWFFDYDNDGWPDLFVTSFYASVDETVRTYQGAPHNAPTMKLYKNLGNGKFKDVTAEVGLDKVFMPMGANFGDIDNDGFLDIYLGTGIPSYGALVPNVLLRNHDGKYFVDVTASSGTGELHKGHGVAFADIDNSGHEAILAVTGGATPGDSHTFRLFENPGNDNDWINIKLAGVKTNRPAIGVRIKVTVENKGQGKRSIYRWVGSGGSFGASPFEQHIGLGKSARIAEVEIWWPTSKTRQTFSDVGKNQFIEIKEFASDYAKLKRPRYRLGGAKRGVTSAAAKSPAEKTMADPGKNK